MEFHKFHSWTCWRTLHWVDPYYLAHKSNELGYNPEIILSGRRINDSIPTFIVKRLFKPYCRHQTHHLKKVL